MSMKSIPPQTPRLYRKTGFAGVYLFFLFLIHVGTRGEAVLTCTNNQCFEQKLSKFSIFASEKNSFWASNKLHSSWAPTTLDSYCTCIVSRGCRRSWYGARITATAEHKLCISSWASLNLLQLIVQVCRKETKQ